jgi:hypothetical protein
MQYAAALRIAGMADSVVTHEPYLATHRHDYGPTVLYRTLAGQFVLGRDYAKALKVQRLIKEDYARVLIAAIMERRVIQKILRHLKLAVDPPAIAPARQAAFVWDCSSP